MIKTALHNCDFDIENRLFLITKFIRLVNQRFSSLINDYIGELVMNLLNQHGSLPKNKIGNNIVEVDYEIWFLY